MKKSTKIGIGLLGAAAVFCAFVFFAQTTLAHRDAFFAPSYQPVELNETLNKEVLTAEDYQLLFTQTGLGKPAVDVLLGKGQSGIDEIFRRQEEFFHPPETSCVPLLGWFTRADKLVAPEEASPLVSLEPGDILVSLSTHSMGWTHGHAALVLDENTTLESQVLGQNSTLHTTKTWTEYASYAVLRIKDAPETVGAAAAEFAQKNLLDVPYRLTAGWFRDKAVSMDSGFFGLQCAYLVWYAYEYLGYDLDSDGGKLVTPRDMLMSGLLEVVEIKGFDPSRFDFS